MGSQAKTAAGWSVGQSVIMPRITMVPSENEMLILMKGQYFH